MKLVQYIFCYLIQKKAITSKIITISITSIRFTLLLLRGQEVNRVARTQGFEPKYIFNKVLAYLKE
jgi:hypothetical protein